MNNTEYISGVALQLVDGTVWELPSKDQDGNQNRHYHVMEYMKNNGCSIRDVLLAEQGFTTNHGRYVDRSEALIIAKNANQIVRHISGGDTELYSEHLG